MYACVGMQETEISEMYLFLFLSLPPSFSPSLPPSFSLSYTHTHTVYVCVVVYIHTCVVLQKAEISNEINWTSKVRTARQKVDPLSVLRFYTTHTHTRYESRSTRQKVTNN